MIQELLGGGSNVSIIGGDRSKFSAAQILEGSMPPAACPSSDAGAGAPPASVPENLRCPRCDSSNTKFCYYNNYNLTQPRHFCKTCRRYWTKGGALRNVPIGGGCRKNKGTTIAASAAKAAAAGKLKAVAHEIGKSPTSSLFGDFDNADQAANPIIWPASSQNSQFLSLIRANQNPNPNSLKEEGLLFGSPNPSSESPIPAGGIPNRILNFDPLGSQLHLSPNSVYRSQTQGEFLQNSGFQELYQRLRSSGACYPDQPPLIPGTLVSAITNSSPILESAPVGTTNTAGELGFWNSGLSWNSDLPTTTNGAYP